MATVTFQNAVYDTNAGAKNATAFTPAVGDQIVVFSGHSGVATPPTITDNQGGTYTIAGSGCLRSGSTTAHAWYVRDALVSSAVSHTVTSTPGGTSTGGGLAVYTVTGVTKTGATAIASSGNQNNQSSGATPSVTLSATPNTNNIIFGGTTQALNSTTAVTPPTSFTENFENGHASPTSSIEVCHRNTGHTSSSVTWGATVAAAFGATAFELDTSGGGAAATSLPPRRRSVARGLIQR